MSGSEAGAGASKRVSLEQVSMPRLMFALLRQRFTGTMVVPQPAPHPGMRTVWFRGGMPVFTDWAAPSDVLGQVLLGMRLVDDDGLLQALEAMAVSGGLLGEHLLTLGILDRPRLLEGLRQQCTHKLAQLFGLRSGEVTVVVGDGAGVDDDLLPLNVLGLILAAVGVTYDEVRVKSEMGAALEGPLQTTSALARYRSHFGFRPGDEAILRALEQGSTLERLAAGTGVRRAAQLVYTLWACQMLRTGAEVVGSAPPRATTPTPAPTTRATARVAAPTPPPTPRAAAPTPVPTPVHRTRDDLPAVEAGAVAEDGFDAELEALESKITAGAHAFELFGLPLTATKRDLRKAWGDLSRKFHPDALKSQGREHLHERVNHVFAALSEAQQLLGDAEQRDKLRERIERGEHEPNEDGRDATAKAHAVFQSELLAKEADKLLRAHRFDRALERYREAARYDPEEPDLMAAIAWCEYQLSDKGPADIERIKTNLVGVIEQSPRLARAQYFMGFVLADQGRSSAAVDAFRRAARLDPRLIDAERQARAIELRAAQSSTSASEAKGLRGGLKGLFGGKK
ncbi:tetratricopeptide repeat protein [Paraliomyxa miuraensis]|uniref:tetratricopeptide repeat protein n=1 Tax=Paraliomyxa miuraensis TaxID=376150 RepID=UPI00224E2364|nr:tetratricopeptide repeat protein [Paraliomyxa miuraensis]MCX4240566.1 tetratricopeptide repeat protein [Paraliomyxa miuraensis]